MLNKKALAAAVGVPAQYQIERSLRFNSADSAYLTRTPASAGNRKTWTMSLWVKRCALSTTFEPLISNLDSSALNGLYFFFTSADKLKLGDYGSSSYSWEIETTQVFRDTSAWYHIVVALDTTQATASNRFKLYVNGSQVTAFGTANYPTQNSDGLFNNTPLIAIGRFGQYTSYHASYYMTEVNFIDGQALTPSDFGETDADTGIWKPKAFSGTYGTNGFYLDFSDNSGTTSTTLGKDYSGNSNNWTPNNFSVTAGTGNDSLVDTPTPYGTDTGAGGEVRGNYCTLNATSPSITALANGNLQFNYNATNSAPGTIGVTSGKWYFEGVVTTQVSSEQIIGVVNQTWVNSTSVGADANGWGIIVQSNANNGQAYHNGSVTSSYATFANGDIAMVAFDVDSGKIWFGRNGTWFNSGAPASGTGNIYSNLSGTIFPAFNNKVTSGGTLYANFGQRPFAYTAPSGYKALCTTNLPTPTIGATATTRADDYFDTGLYTGNGSSSSRAISGPNNPDFVWIKSRSDASSHALYDRLRGFNQRLYSNTTSGDAAYGSDILTPTSTGFNLTTSDADHNTNNSTYVAWQWKGGGTGVSNTAGSITSTVSANTTAGFSIVTYTGNGTSGATVGHGLGATPSLIIVKARSVAGEYWMTYHTSLGNTKAIFLQRTDAESTSSTYWNNTSPTSTLFSLGTNGSGNGNGTTYVAYCFAPVAGYSAFGSYTGNGSTDGPFVYTGFRPAFILLKANSSGYNWDVIDSKRNTYNVVDNHLFPDTSGAEQTLSTNQIDFCSNGFKNRTGNYLNVNGVSYIYAAFAENPFKYSLAR